MAMTITEVLNTWNNLGVFSYVIPFLLIFAVVFALLQKSRILSGSDNENKPLMAIVAASVGLLALQMDIVSTFFAVIFPRFGIGISILLVAMILLGFFAREDSNRWMGIVIGIAIIVWALASWSDWIGGYYTSGWYYYEDLWSLIILAGVIGLIYLVSRGGGSESKPKKKKEGE